MQQQYSEYDYNLSLLARVANLTSSSLNASDIFEGVFWEIKQRFEVDACWVQIYDSIDKKLVLNYQKGFPESMTEEMKSIVLGEGISGIVALSREPVICSDIMRESENAWNTALQSQFRSCTILPVVCAGQILGIFGLLSSTPNYFTNEHLKMISIIVSSLADVYTRTAIKKEIEARLKQEEYIKQTQQFLNTLGHELKTPLTAIVATTGLFLEMLEKKEETVYLRFAQNIARSASSLENRLKELLDLSRSKVQVFGIQKKTFNFADFTKIIIEQITPIARRKNQSLVMEELPSVSITADEQRLEQILFNLVSNAVKFTPEGGQIFLKARTNSDSLVVEIQDTGKGIPSEEKPSLFLPYYRLMGDRQSSPGLGLGLAITKQLVELHGGKIWFESEEGRGSTFYFSLPLTDNKV